MAAAASYDFQLRLHKIHYRHMLLCLCSKNVFLFLRLQPYVDLPASSLSSRINQGSPGLSTQDCFVSIPTALDRDPMLK